MLKIVEVINERVQGIVWGTPMLVLIIGTGILMSFLTRFFQFSHMGLILKTTVGGMFKSKKQKNSTDKRSITQFQALCTALAATIGTGNIAGVAAAITVGGPGAVFWMWVSAFFGMATNFAENILGIYYRRKNFDGEWSGGAMYYLRDGLGAKKGCRRLGALLAALFAFFCIVASFGIGNAVQVNTIACAMKGSFAIPTIATGIFVMAAGGLVILKGIKSIAAVTEKLVPFMALAYTVGAVIIMLTNADRIGEVFEAIFRGAFGFDAVSGGAIGTLVAKTVTLGFKRGVFSNEAGLGSSVAVHAASDVVEPAEQGMWAIFEVFADTIIICSLTAFAVLASGAINLESGLRVPSVSADGVDLVSYAFSTGLHSAAGAFISVVVLLFAFATCLGWSYYGVKSAEYLFGAAAVTPYKIIFVLMMAVGAVADIAVVWGISDIFNALMAIPNLIGVIALSGNVRTITKNYVNRKLKKTQEKPILSAFADIQKMQEKKL